MPQELSDEAIDQELSSDDDEAVAEREDEGDDQDGAYELVRGEEDQEAWEVEEAIAYQEQECVPDGVEGVIVHDERDKIDPSWFGVLQIFKVKSN